MIADMQQDVLKNSINGEITTSQKSVVIHSRQQFPDIGRDETECPVKAGRMPNRKMVFSNTVLISIQRSSILSNPFC